MRSCILGIILLAVMAPTASAQSVQWRGVAFLDAVNQACINEGLAKGDNYTARFRAPGLGGSPSYGLSMFATFNAQTFDLPANIKVGDTVNAGGAQIYGAGGSYNPGDRKVKLVALKPMPVTATTPVVEVTLQINNFDGTKGCVVTVRSALARRP